ncbi:hypothetical protein OIE62_27750 [Streptomyces scopuliridis]|uniref:Uncharacterized protein n=1 Tax=Streptomyces scopuliridis TaxID=452529 RepID=A0ACD4ZHB8_9ACTN|nr:hypothetical protein [Streptomyces scopuliridis]WSB33603.1 hypothetical protein OG949_12485 [Streptomyces scopuliridis]WSB97877.1 hypothetical protein OG835_13190 [Streptomyces scopuliridis]WSC08420.1 hypothetical protein OIE62_27750 [Streptomyces scopuliridis]
MSETASPFRRGRLLRIAAALVVLLALAAYVVVQYVSGGGGPPRCLVRAADAAGGDSPTYEMTPEQAENAATIAAVGTTRGLPERAVTIALATALQESALRNLDHGDRDSLGLFQQRPSTGWGTETQIQDPVYSAGQFYDHLVKVPGYSRLPLTEAAQRVQRSGFPQAYAKHEPDAALLAAALTGRSAATLTCTAPSGAEPGDPAKVRAALVRDFGAEVLPGTDAAGRAGASGTAAEVSVPVPATTGGSENGGSSSLRGWELAHWAVAQSTALRIDEVSYAGRVWSAKNTRSANKGWQRTRASEQSAGSGAGSGADSGLAEVRIRTAQ